MAADDLRGLLDRTELFHGLDPAALNGVLASASRYQTGSGGTLLLQGESANDVFVVAEGRFKVAKITPGGAQVVIRFMGPGDLIGCVAVFRRIAYPATATAVVDSVALGWSASQIADLMERHPPIAQNAIRIIGNRTEEMLERFCEVATERVEQRIARTLLRLADQAGQKVENGVEIAFTISRQDLAEMTGTTLYTVSRMLSAWEQQGLVQTRRKRIVILTPPRLAAIAEHS